MPMRKEVVTAGDGSTFPQRGQTVKVHYVGTFQSGQEFDSSRKRGDPFTFKIGMGQVIKGWDEGVKQMSKGERSKFEFSPDLAYGQQGYPPAIPPNSTLFFDIELIDMS